MNDAQFRHPRPAVARGKGWYVDLAAAPGRVKVLVGSGVLVAILAGACLLGRESLHRGTDWGAGTATRRYFGLVQRGDLRAAYRMLCADVVAATGMSEAQYESFIRTQDRFDSYSVVIERSTSGIDGTRAVARVSTHDGHRAARPFRLTVSWDPAGPAVCDGPTYRSYPDR